MTNEEAINFLKSINKEDTAVCCDGALFTLDEYGVGIIDMAIEALSVDLVRCKDCKHGKVETEPRRPWEGDITCKLDCTDREWYKGDYCSYGERRSDD